MAEPVEAVVWKDRNPLARRGVRRRHEEFPTVHMREPVALPAVILPLRLLTHLQKLRRVQLVSHRNTCELWSARKWLHKPRITALAFCISCPTERARLRNKRDSVSRCFRIDCRRGRTRNFDGDSCLNCRPRKSKPSVARTSLVFSSLRRSPLAARKSRSFGRTTLSSCRLERASTTRSSA